MLLCAITLNGKFTERITRDGLRRVSQKTLTRNSSDEAFIRDVYSYLAGANGSTTQFVSGIAQKVGEASHNLAYTYDVIGDNYSGKKKRRK